MTVASVTVTALLDAAKKGGISAATLAQYLGVTRQMIYLYRDGTHVPDDVKLANMQDLTKRISDAVKEGKLPRPARQVEIEIWEALNYPDYKK